jgi:hypothetical protein
VIRSVLQALRRRWYITFPSLILAGILAVGAWLAIPPTFERSASVLLVPGAGSVPEDGNPYFYLGGLTNAADVLVRAVGSENVQHQMEAQFRGIDIEVARDASTAGPVILIVVNARTDTDAVAALDLMVKRAGAALESLQVADRVARADRITMQVITIDQQATLRQRTRLVVAAVVGAGIAALGALIAALVDGLSNQRRRRRSGVPPPAGVAVDDAEGLAGERDQDVEGTSTAQSIPDDVAQEVDAVPPTSPDAAGPTEEPGQELVGSEQGSGITGDLELAADGSSKSAVRRRPARGH